MLRNDGETIEPLFGVLKHDVSGRVKKFSMYTKHTAVITYLLDMNPSVSGSSAMHRHTLNGVKAHAVQCTDTL